MGIQEICQEKRQNIANYYNEMKEKHPNTCNNVQNIGSIMLAYGTGKYMAKIMENKIQKPINLSFANELVKNGNILTKEEIFKGFENTKLFEEHGVFLHDYSDGYPIFENRTFQNRFKKAQKEHKELQKSLEFWNLWENNPQKAQKKLERAMLKARVKNWFLKPYNKFDDKLAKSKIVQKALPSLIFGSYEEVLSGANSFFMPQFNDINVNIDKMGESAFHEMGHAMNFNKKGVGHCLLKLRFANRLLPLISLTALLRKPKNQGEKSDTILGQGLDFVKDNCVSLAALCSAPTILEEFVASKKATKIAKNVLSSDKLKVLKRFNAKAWMTYVATGLASIATVWAIDKMRNITSSKKD